MNGLAVPPLCNIQEFAANLFRNIKTVTGAFVKLIDLIVYPVYGIFREYGGSAERCGVIACEKLAFLYKQRDLFQNVADRLSPAKYHWIRLVFNVSFGKISGSFNAYILFGINRFTLQFFDARFCGIGYLKAGFKHMLASFCFYSFKLRGSYSCYFLRILCTDRPIESKHASLRASEKEG